MQVCASREQVLASLTVAIDIYLYVVEQFRNLLYFVYDKRFARRTVYKTRRIVSGDFRYFGIIKREVL